MEVTADSEFDFIYIALGAGVGSTALYLLSADGTMPRADVAIFADTGDEPRWVYDHLERLSEWAKENDGPPIETVGIGRLSEHLKERQAQGFAPIPAFTPASDGRESMLRRQCTREYKIAPIEKRVRHLLGYEPRFKVRESVGCMLGISLDEAHRMRESRTRWITNLYPLVGQGVTREQCRKINTEAGFPDVKRSSCVFCPYHSDDYWRELRDNFPDEWERAIEIDRTIRDMTASGIERPVYLHRSLVPLDEVDLDSQTDLWGSECEGYCGV